MNLNKGKNLFILMASFAGLPLVNAETKLTNLTLSPQAYSTSCESSQKELKLIQNAQYNMTPLDSSEKLSDLQAKHDAEVAKLVLIDGMKDVKDKFDKFLNETTKDLQINSPVAKSIETLTEGSKATKRLGIMHAMVAELLNFRIARDESDKTTKETKDFLENGKLPSLAEGETFYNHVKGKCSLDQWGENRICAYLNNELKKDKSVFQKAGEFISADIEQTINGFYNAMSKRSEDGNFDVDELKSYHKLLTGEPDIARVTDLDAIDNEYFKKVFETDTAVTKALEDSITSAQKQIEDNKSIVGADFYSTLAKCKINRAYGATVNKDSACGNLSKFNEILGKGKDTGYFSSVNNLKENIKNAWGITKPKDLDTSGLISLDGDKAAKKTFDQLTTDVTSVEDDNNAIAKKIQKHFNKLKEKSESASITDGYTNLLAKLDDNKMRNEVLNDLCGQNSQVMNNDSTFNNDNLLNCLKNNSLKIQNIDKAKEDAALAAETTKKQIESITNNDNYKALQAIKRFATNEVINSCSKDQANKKEFFKCNDDSDGNQKSFMYFADSSNKLIAQIDFDLLDGKNKQKTYVKDAYDACSTEQQKERQFNLTDDSKKEEEEKYKQQLSHFLKHTCENVAKSMDVQENGTPRERMVEYFENNIRESDGRGGMKERKKSSLMAKIGRAGLKSSLEMVPSLIQYDQSKYSIDLMKTQAISNIQWQHYSTQYFETMYNSSLYGPQAYSLVPGAYNFYGSNQSMFYSAEPFEW